MAASSISITLTLILLIGSLSAAPEDEDEGAPCVTGKGIPGNCMIRNDCEFSTPAIDLTLYKPKGFVSTCSEKQVCCPEKYQIQRTELPQDQEKDEDFSFDDDD